jgi:hypothetical protein
MILFFPLHFFARLPSDHIVNCCSPWLGAEGKVHFFYFYESHFPSAFFLFPFSVLTFSTFLIVDEGGRRDLHK